MTELADTPDLAAEATTTDRADIAYPTSGDSKLDAHLDDVLARTLALPTITLLTASHLRGDDPRPGYPLGRCIEMMASATIGNVAVVEGNAREIEYRDEHGKVTLRREREHLHYLHVDRASMRDWLRDHGSDADRVSRLATWANFVEAE